MGSKHPVRSSIRPGSSTAQPARRRVFEIDGGYVVLMGKRLDVDPADARRDPYRGRYLTIVVVAPAAGHALAGSVRSVAALDPARVLVYEAEDRVRTGEAATLFGRALRSACRAECRVILESLRALRHCIDGIAPGDVVLYCCDRPAEAARILHEYGATEVAEPGPPELQSAVTQHALARAHRNRVAAA
jgi:hypothetical protein